MKITTLLIGFLALIVLTSCGVDKESKNTKLIQNFDDNKVVVKLINTSEQNGGISYNISLKNENSSIIKQNNVFIIFPLKSQNGTKTNPLKIEAQGNKIDISSNQEVVLKAFVPKEVLEKTHIWT